MRPLEITQGKRRQRLLVLSGYNVQGFHPGDQTTIQINTCMSKFKTDFVNKHAIQHPTRPLCGRCQTIGKVEGTDQ